jgi:monovalent cation:proton antiporter-2 (CPA2) family protein
LGDISLFQVAVLLAAAGIVAPLARYLRIGAVVGYLLAGVAIGPYVLGIFTNAEKILHIAEFGVVLLLFMIGLQLKPRRLWAMRRAVFGLGGSQVAVTAIILTAIMLALADGWREAMFVGLALSLSSTAMVLQVLKETGELELRHGRIAFSVLLFQDLAAIPMIAFVGLLSVSGENTQPMTLQGALTALVAIAAIALAGRYLLGRTFHLIARTGVSEAMTAFALLTIVVIEIIMTGAGLSSALGAFIAGALLADSTYRHEIEANIKPFETLFLGLFFISIGMLLNLGLLSTQTSVIALSAAGLMIVKGLILHVFGRRYGLTVEASRRFACALAQGGEFAFVLTAIAITTGVIVRDFAALINVIVTVTMLATPAILMGEKWLASLLARPASAPAFDDIPGSDAHVVIAGLGRFGQIIARILAARDIPFTALDGDPTQIEVIRRFGGRVYFGDATRPEILAAAQVEKARAVVVCISSVEDSLKTVELLRRNYPHVPIYARARDRNHAHRLMDLGVEQIIRETFLSAVEMSRRVLVETGLSYQEAERTVRIFAERDEHRLRGDYAHASDQAKLAESAKRHAQELAELFETDIDKPG